MRTALKLSLDEYHKMIARGAFNDLRGRHIELIYGELREMSPQGPWHAETLTLLEEWSSRTVGAAIRKRVQMPITLASLDSEPEPDLVWANRKHYRDGHPTADDILLVVEVSYATLAEDLGENAELYAQAGIVEYWVADIINRVVHVFRQPSATGYLQHDQYAEGSRIAPLAFPSAVLDVGGLFPE